MENLKSKKLKGFSLTELLVALGVIAIIISAVLGLLGRGLDVLRREAHRRVAIGIANERLELFRNVPYDDVGTSGGIPNGAFPQEELIERNGARYTARTRVRFIDDPFDDMSPLDAVPADYREVAVDVSWGANPNQTVTLATFVAPPGLEQATTTGTLRIRVIDASGGPVEGASVHIANASVTPPIALTLPTDGRGEITLPGAPPSTAGYAVRVTRDGYSTDTTVPPSDENPNPTQPPLTILEHEVTTANFAIDRLASIALTFRRYGNDQSFRDLTTFTLQGSKSIGAQPNPTPPPDTLPVYKAAPQSFTTNQGALTIAGLEWDTYQFTETMTDHDLATVDPLLPIELLPGMVRPITIAFAPHHDHTLRVIVRDAAGLPLEDADATLAYTDGSPQEEQATTPPHGQVFFAPLRPGTALLTISRTNFETATRELTIDGQTEVEVRLQASEL
ncbi:MAG: carboxypeptidase regulatory-like domain-containing protein [bacterium]|nr:carboxypeptidase regulatory-like domain-containing protein [bacterium]